MAIPLNVPFLPEPGYAAFLQDQKQHLHSLHFAFYPGATVFNARQNLDFWPTSALVTALQPLEGVHKYALLNSRFFAPATYFDTAKMALLADNLSELQGEAGITGIIFSDFYLLQALSRFAPALCAHLEAVPSVNCMLDSIDKITAHLELIKQTSFKMPKKLTLDRSLNRDMPRLSELSRRCRTLYPQIKLELLANEGCLFQCPFKLSHDAHISLANITDELISPHQINRELGCITLLAENPHLLFKSPFIRPEDSQRYHGLCDTIKICGRTLGPPFLRRVISAYRDEKYCGNILDLMDTMEWLANTVHVENSSIPDNFLNRLLACDKACETCTYCANVFAGSAQKTDMRLKDLRE